jgi:dihydroorotase
LSRALAEGVIDSLCSDHTPVDEDGKHLPFAEAEPGATGLELLLPLTLKWAGAHQLALPAALARITSEPAKIRGVASGRIAHGAPGDLAIFDPQAGVRIAPETLKSQGKNTPFLGYELAGRVKCTVVAGNVVYEG